MKYVMQVLVVAIFVTVAAVAKGDWVYWTVDFNDYDGNPAPWSAEEAPSTVWLTAKSSGGSTVNLLSLNNYGNSYADKDFSDPENGWSLKDYFFQSDLNSLGQLSAADMTYYVEMGDAIGSAAWTSEGISYDGLIALSAISSGMATSGDMVTYWAPTMWTSTVPEPTSGLLMLVGMGLLALRRKRT